LAIDGSVYWFPSIMENKDREGEEREDLALINKV